jgi:hypothetical protein
MELLILLFATTGFASIIYGVSQLSTPAGWITFGCCCLLLAGWPFIRERILR